MSKTTTALLHDGVSLIFTGCGVDRTGDSDTSTSTAVSETSSSDTASRKQRCKFRKEWKETYLMWPNESEGFMTCILCSEKLTSFKVSTITRHIERKHKQSLQYTPARRQRLISTFQRGLLRQQALLKKAMTPNQLRVVAPYKLAFTIAKYKMPFSSSEAFTAFARAADPENVVFKDMARSRNTIATKTVELYQKLLRPELTEIIGDSPYWSLMADDSTDCSIYEQCGVYARFINMQDSSITTRFLSLERIHGHPNAENIFQGIMQVIGSAGLNLPLHKLVGFTCDGASVMISSNQGVLGKLRREMNPKLFSIHCPPHRMILASKAAQKELPDFVEKLVGDVLFYFRDSPTRRDQFKSLMELTDPDHEYITIVQYHKIRWLSLSDCVNRVCMLLSSLVLF